MFGRLIDGFNGWRRGEVRVAPYGVRGRVWVKKDAPVAEPSGPGVINIGVTPTATLEMKVTRADGSVEIINVPATAEIIN